MKRISFLFVVEARKQFNKGIFFQIFMAQNKLNINKVDVFRTIWWGKPEDITAPKVNDDQIMKYCAVKTIHSENSVRRRI